MSGAAGKAETGRAQFTEQLEALLVAAVRLAILRSDLVQHDTEDPESDEDIGRDAAWACQGEGTCDETPLPEWTAIVERVSSLERERDQFKSLAKMVVTIGKPEYVECDDIGAKTAGWEVKMVALSDWKGICAKAKQLLEPGR